MTPRLTPNMNLRVHPLRVLATREVVMNSIDYSTYLNGPNKQELDRLDMLAGDFKIQASKLRIEGHYNGERLPPDDWEYFKACFEDLPTCRAKILEGTEEFFIQRRSKNGLRTWFMSDYDFWVDRLANRGKLIPSSGTRCWDFYDDFIENGSLVSIVKIYRMENGKTELVFNFRESITPDDQGNIKWDVAWRYRDIKIIKVMWAQRENNVKMFFYVIIILFHLLLLIDFNCLLPTYFWHLLSWCGYN